MAIVEMAKPPVVRETSVGERSGREALMPPEMAAIFGVPVTGSQSRLPTLCNTSVWLRMLLCIVEVVAVVVTVVMSQIVIFHGAVSHRQNSIMVGCCFTVRAGTGVTGDTG